MNDNQFARCGAKADHFPFNKSPIGLVENMFSTGTELTEDALWLGVSLPAPVVAETCSNCCARKKADRHLLLLVHTVCRPTPLSGRGVWDLGDFATRRCVSESVSFSCSDESLICRCCSCWTEWTLQCCCRRYCCQRPEAENQYKLLWLHRACLPWRRRITVRVLVLTDPTTLPSWHCVSKANHQIHDQGETLSRRHPSNLRYMHQWSRYAEVEWGQWRCLRTYELSETLKCFKKGSQFFQ